MSHVRWGSDPRTKIDRSGRKNLRNPGPARTRAEQFFKIGTNSDQDQISAKNRINPDRD